MKKIVSLIFILTLLSSASLKSQSRSILNLGNFDEKWIHFGFSLGLNGANFIGDYELGNVDSLAGINSITQNGFSLGIVTDLHLTPILNLRVIPALSFGDRRIHYTFLRSNGSQARVERPVESTFIDVPINLKFRSFRYENFAAYIVGGGMYSYDLISQKDVINSNNNLAEMVIKLNTHNMYYQLGVGFDFFLEYFKFSPEIKMSYGLNNVHVQDGSTLSLPINNLRSKIFLISLTFEG